MKTVAEVIDGLEEAAIDRRVAPPFISGTTRVDVEFMRDLGAFSYRVNGMTESREQAERALERARATPGHPFMWSTP